MKKRQHKQQKSVSVELLAAAKAADSLYEQAGTALLRRDYDAAKQLAGQLALIRGKPFERRGCW